MLRSSATSYFHADGLGSVTSLSNAAGSMANTYTYDSFGKLTASTGSLVNPFQYTAPRIGPRKRDCITIAPDTTIKAVADSLVKTPLEIRRRAGTSFRYVYNSPTGFGPIRWALSAADVQRILAACKKCTKGLTDSGTTNGWGGVEILSWGLVGAMIVGRDQRPSIRVLTSKEAILHKPSK